MRSFIYCFGGVFLENKRKKNSNSNVVSFIPNGEYYFQKAIKALERNEMDTAYKYIKRAAELSPDDAQILLQYSVLEMEAQNFDVAYELIHTAYSLDPNDEEILFVLAEASGCIGLMGDAKKYAQKYLDKSPNGVYAEDAIDILEFVDEDPLDMEPTEESETEKLIAQEKARRFMENGEFQKAIEILEFIVDKYPDLWAAYNNLALAYFYLGEAEQAKALLNHVLRENHGNLHALCNVAVVAYYEKNEAELKDAIDVLKKIQPYDFENRYKLGATLALIGEYETSYKWLRSLKKIGYEGDVGYYFWLAQAAYFTGNDETARSAWRQLVAMDPSKEGYEPWANSKQQMTLSNAREFILNKIMAKDEEDHLFGLYLLKNSPHKQEIIAHPKWIDVSKYSELVQIALAYALNYTLNKKNNVECMLHRMMETAEIISEHNQEDAQNEAQLLNIWFALSKIAYYSDYKFKNTAALAAAVEYSFINALSETVTKKAIAEKYEISTATLTKYEEELYSFIPEQYL